MMALKRGFHGMLDTQYATIASWRVTKRELVPYHMVSHTRRLLYQFRTHFHPYAERLVAELVANDIDGLQELDTAEVGLREEFFKDRYVPAVTLMPTNVADFGGEPAAVLDRFPVKELDFDYAEGAYAVYNWELFYHVPYTIALQLSKNGRYADAQRWFHYIFDPTATGKGDAPSRFWKFRPFRIDEVEHVAKTLLNLSTGDDDALRDRTIAAIGNWRDNPFRPHLVARSRPTAYMYATVMSYLDNLIAWGDSLFRQDTRESINEAMQYYVLAANILGPKPDVVPKKGSIATQTYASLRNDLDEFGNAARELEADIPFDLVAAPAPVTGTPADVTLESLGRSLYFCVPRNDKLLGYWTTVGDRMFKIRNSLNIDGVFRQLPLFAPPIDPRALARAIAAGVDVASIIAGTAAPLAPVRFNVMLQKSLELCQEVKQLGGQILAALEKKDNEALGVLRARYESNLLGLTESVRYAQWQETIKNKEGIVISLHNAFERFRYYDRLMGAEDAKIKEPEYLALDAPSVDRRSLSGDEPIAGADDVEIELGASFRDGGHKISPPEAHELDLMEVAQIIQDASVVLEGVGAFLNLVPEFTGAVSPLGVGAHARFGGSNLGRLFQGLSGVVRGVGARVQHEATLAGRMASYDRREQDWAFQRRSAAGEMTQLYKQYRGAELREYIAKHEYENHQRQMAQAKDVEDFLTNEKRKTTTESFYLWMKREAQGLHAQYFQFAYDVAKRAERALQHELGRPEMTFIRSSYLAGREGLFAGEKLQLDIKRMDLAYADLNTREDSLVKHISLRDWFPLQFIQLRATRKCEVQIPESLFDLDCPGHMFRRIHSVAVTIPCVVGPYASVNCRLTLLDSQVRLAVTNPWYPADPAADTEHFTSYPVAKDSIVTSGAQNDNGMLEADARDERYLPFEGAGVISKWAIELVGDPPQIDYDTISDVVLTFQYRARAGAASETVSTAAKKWLKENSTRVFSMRHEFPTEFARFQDAVVPANQKAKLGFALGAEHFPYRMHSDFTKARRLHIFASTSAAAVEVELLRDNVSVGKTTLASGVGILVPPAAGGQLGSFDPRGSFELRFDTRELSDLWLVLDWSGGGA